MLQWPMVDDYRVAVVTCKSGELKNTMVSMHIKALLASRYDSYTFAYQGDIVAIYRMADVDLDYLKGHLAVCAKNTSRYIGLSERFTHFMELPGFFEQAAFASRTIGGRSADTPPSDTTDIVRFMEYTDCFIDHIMSRCHGILPSNYDVEILAAYDEENATDYRLTLFNYLMHGKRIDTTASIMYLHRNTLSRRLVHISSLLSGDLDDANYCLELTFALKKSLSV